MQVTDPISDTAIMMMTCPVQLILTEVGVALFKDRPTSLFPFTHMDSAQRYFVEEVVRDCLLHCDVATRHVYVQGLPFYRMHHHAVVQMGGGCILYMHHSHPAEALLADSGKVAAKKGGGGGSSKKGQAETAAAAAQKSLLPADEVLKSMCDCVFASTQYGDSDVRLAICNILLQRIVGMCSAVTVQDQRAVHEYCNEAVKEWRAKDLQDSNAG